MASPDENQSLLENIRGIHLPQPPSDDTGVIIFLLLALALSFALLIYALVTRANRASGWKRDALSALQRARKNIVAHPDTCAIELTQTAATLRSVTREITGNPSQFTGTNYMLELDELFKTRFFTADAGKLFGDTIYKSAPVHNDVLSAIDGLVPLIKKWK